MTQVPSDPRIRPALDDARPIVAPRRADLPLWMIVLAAITSAVILFLLLEQRRQAAVPTVQASASDGVILPAALPPLPLDRGLGYEPPPPPPPPPATVLAPTVARPAPIQVPAQAVSTAMAQPSAPASFPAQTFAPPPVVTSPGQPQYLPSPGASASPALVVDTLGSRMIRGSGLTEDQTRDPADGQSARGESGAQAETSNLRLQRRATTVPQGALIPAVLETALDSTRPGNVRAMVSRDVFGFDGSQVLIPRGSRLFGTYEADLAPGQNRAFVLWTRLVRPDGFAIALDSPAADQLGRTGIQGRVDTHFLQRFGAALLQSTLNFGSTVAGRSIGGDSPVVVALPGSNTAGAMTSTQAQYQPTLRVPAGVSVTVFVSQDLQLPAARRR